jgi:response regulator NasT
MRRSDEPLRLVVADDEPVVRLVLCELLQEEGFEVVGQAADGAEAVSLAVSLQPDAVLLDIKMPRLGGIEAARQIRPQDPNVRLVMLSAYDDPALQSEASEVGASAFLVKGCSLVELVGALKP